MLTSKLQWSKTSHIYHESKIQVTKTSRTDDGRLEYGADIYNPRSCFFLASKSSAVMMPISRNSANCFNSLM